MQLSTVKTRYSKNFSYIKDTHEGDCLKNYGEYKITRVNVTFSSSLCSDNTSLPSEHTKTVELSDKEDASITSVPAIAYKCARVNNLWGIIKS